MGKTPGFSEYGVQNGCGAERLCCLPQRERGGRGGNLPPREIVLSTKRPDCCDVRGAGNHRPVPHRSLQFETEPLLTGRARGGKGNLHLQRGCQWMAGCPETFIGFSSVPDTYCHPF